MADNYHEVENATELSDEDSLSIDRARRLVSAIKNHDDYLLIRLHKRTESGIEYITVDVEVDQVPPKNPHGIKYRERLAICVPEDPKQVPDVRALRTAFPTLPHQNQSHPGDVPSLCLYFEPPASVLRTWTPQKFLRRIQWWLEKTAKGELHPADQPVEQLFFLSKYELVLPWDFDEKRQTNHQFQIAPRAHRPDGGVTLFLEDINSAAPEETRAECIEFDLPPVVHGVIERQPYTLGQLEAQLQGRGIGLLQSLKNKLANRVGEKGAATSSDNPYTVFVLHVPMCRAEGAKAETTHHRVFLVDAGPLKLGEQIGVLFQYEGRYFSAEGLLDNPAATEWEDTEVLSVDVLRENDRAAARQQSGIGDDPGPAGVLIGAGSLGSSLLNFWNRAGWGQWTTIDKDHIKPHNLSRHIAFVQHIGQPKAFVAAGLSDAAIGEGESAAIFGDACKLDDDEILHAIRAASIVVDASTSLEYPRQASTRDDLPRHVSTFLTPDGNSAVLLAEDGERKTRLRTLEAQYYRALIEHDWGEHHLKGNLGTFWSGASCRDISTVLPLSRIQVHSSTLAEQIPSVLRDSKPVIRIWERSALTGIVVAHNINTQHEQSRQFGSFKLFLDDGVEKSLRELRSASLPNETGGVLLGYYDFNVNEIVIVCGLPAPPDSKASPEGFERGTEGLAEAVNEATRRTGGIVGYIGEWHSHPPNHSANPSGHDILQLFHLAFGMAEDGLPALQLIVGENDLGILQGQVPS